LPIVPLTYALSVFGVMRALGASAGALFLAIGRPDLRTKIQLAQLVILVASIYPLYLHYGVLGVAWAVSAYGLLSVYAALLCMRISALPLASLAWPCLQVGSASLLAAAAAWAIGHVWLAGSPLLGLIAGGLGFALVLVAILAWLDRPGERSYRAELEQAFKALRRPRP